MNKSKQLSFFVVPDMLAPGAFDAAIKGVKYVIHIASPVFGHVEVAPEDHHKHFIEPAVRGTIAMLEAAKASGTVKRVVVTSSVVAQIPLAAMFVEESDHVFVAEDRLPEMEAPYANAPFAYAASKIASLNTSERWMIDQAPSFDLINIMPSVVVGRDDLIFSSNGVSSLEGGTNSFIMAPILGVTAPPFGGTSVHNDDVALAHVLALDPAVEGNQSFITSSDGIAGMRFDDAMAIVAKRFPEAVAKGILPNNGSAPTIHVKLDVSKTERILGFKHKNFEEQVVNIVDHYLELLEKEQGVSSIEGLKTAEKQTVAV